MAASSPTRLSFKAEVKAEVKVEMRIEMERMIEEAIGPLRDAASSQSHNIGQAQAATEMQGKQIEDLRKATGQVVNENLTRAEELLAILDGKMNHAGQLAEYGQERINSLMNEMNNRHAALQNAMVEDKAIIKAWASDLSTKIQQDKANADSSAEQFNQQLETTFINLVNNCQAEFGKQSKSLQDAESRILKSGVAGGAATGKGGSAKLTTKDVTVEKLVEKASVLDFRKWLKAIELQLEHVFGKQHIEELILNIRKIRSPITEEVWIYLLRHLHEEHPHKLPPSEWDFEEHGRWMHSYMISKLHTSLFEVCANIQDQNGFELLRLISDHMDRIPEKAAFHFGIVLQDTIMSKDGGLQKCKTFVETSRIVHELETAAIDTRRLLVVVHRQKD